MTANAHSVELDFYEMFEEHGSVMLLIDAKTGAIEHANQAASDFYGYSIQELESMKIHQINVLSEEENNKRIAAATKRKLNNYILEQRLASGEIRTVEVYSCPHTHGDKILLFAIIHDITDKVRLEERNELISNTLITVLSGVVALICLFSFILNKNLKKVKARNHEIDTYNKLRKTYIDADDKQISLKDENLKYLFVNKALEDFFQKQESEIIGKSDFDVAGQEFASMQHKLDLDVLEKKSLIIDEIAIGNSVYKTTKFPVKLINGNYGVGTYMEDITEEHHRKIQEEKNLLRNQILVDVLTRHFDSTQEQLDYVLNESLRLTESQYGYIFLYDEDGKEFTLSSWSKGVMADCEIIDKQTIYSLQNTGLWGEVVRQREPIIINNYEAFNPMKKGYPEGHVGIQKYMSIPVIIEGRIVAVVGLANKEEDYNYYDVYQMIALMNGIWYAKERRESLVKLAVERNKVLQILMSIGDGVMVVDREGHVQVLNLVAEKLTGWTNDEARGRHYKEVFVLSHEDEKLAISDPIEKVFKTDTIQVLENHAVLTSKDGVKYHIEDSAAPIKDEKKVTTGVVLVFRDITEKKEQRERIEYLSYHDELTGLYNRRRFEEELKRIDVKENLPISILSGDMNGLKLANDIFGHEAGDMLLKSAAKVLKSVCRKKDIIARVGGDEFVVLLPGTSSEDGEKIMKRIRDEFSRIRVKAIHGSISMGCHTKTHEDEEILQTLKVAESKMYSVKVTDRSKIKSSTIKTIIEELHRNNPNEKTHSKNVSEICESIGRYMHLPEHELRRLKEAGYLHDIGKIGLDEGVLHTDEMLTDHIQNEMKQHAVIGYRILNSFDDTIDLAEPILAHHENWDGTGYPKGLKGEEIPKSARIIAVAETYDAAIRRRGLNAKEAIQEIRKQAGYRFDPEIVDIFVKMMSDQDEKSNT
ncbi:MAG: diguanylate cyclase [Clostridia bacterium]